MITIRTSRINKFLFRSSLGCYLVYKRGYAQAIKIPYDILQSL